MFLRQLSQGLPTDGKVQKGPHNLRHTFGRRLRSARVPLETRRVLMHHVDGDVTVHYSPAELAELKEAVESITQIEQVTMLRAAVWNLRRCVNT
ncbi:integrase [Candidatus Methylospira mobilis]|uniref:Integrase n=1 Tax=Candidatus Methylospira mobilis TaxID=1808979 RepID=A0A5Q0BS14_9GAMM|nr:integrase [Candidatus Methylospira mobilis]